MMRILSSIVLLMIILLIMFGCALSQKQPIPSESPILEKINLTNSPAATDTPDILFEYSMEYSPEHPLHNHNAQLATERMDGVEIPSGETFSFMQQMGEISEKNGWWGAPFTFDQDTFASFRTGAGICAPATCLYLCVSQIDPSIIIANFPHSHPVDYDKNGGCVLGADNTYDFAFKNTFEHSLFIQSIWDDGSITIRLLTVRPDTEDLAE